MDKSQRFNKAFEYLRFSGYFRTQRAAAAAMGATATNFGKALKGEDKVATDNFMMRFCKAYPIISLQWLLTGEGEMLKPTTGNTVSVGTAQQSTVVGGNYYGAPTHTQEEAQLIEAEQVPVVPVTIAKQPELDTIRYLRDNISQVEISSVRVDDTKLTLWLPMPDESMLPEISKGDRLGLLAYCRGKENPIPGKIYAVDTYSNGFVVRYLFITPNGDYLMRSKNPELFPDFIIKKDDVIAVYKKMIMVRI